MGLSEMDKLLKIGDEGQAMVDLAREFGRDVIRPVGIELDKLHDPQDVAQSGSKLWEVHRKYRELGFHKTGVPKALGGLQGEIEPHVGTLISEQFGYADAGLNVSLGVSSFPFLMALMAPDKKMKEAAMAYINDPTADLIGCWAITEPDHGSDWVLGMAGDEIPHTPKTAPSVRARKVGDDYILTGQKSAWVSNGTVATHAVLHVCLEPEKGMKGTGLALLDLSLPGISRGKPLDKLGQRALNQGEIIFDEVKLPKSNMMVPNPQVMDNLGKGILTGANTGMSITFAGLAWAAFDQARNYAHERIQGGVPIIKHQNIKLKIFDMFKRVEAARTLAHTAARFNGRGGFMGGTGGSAKHAVAAKVLATETAFHVASEAVQVHGGYGLAKEYVIEKMFRDARASMIEDGANEALALAVAEDV